MTMNLLSKNKCFSYSLLYRVGSHHCILLRRCKNLLFVFKAYGFILFYFIFIFFFCEWGGGVDYLALKVSGIFLHIDQAGGFCKY